MWICYFVAEGASVKVIFGLIFGIFQPYIAEVYKKIVGQFSGKFKGNFKSHCLKLLNLACLTFSSHFASLISAEVLSLVLLNIQDRFWHNLYAFSK